jgi:cell division protein FtsQ
VLAHNSVDRGSMARDSIELNLDEQTPLSGKPSRARASIQHSSLSNQPEQAKRARTRVSVPQGPEDSDLLINPDDLDLEELDSEEAQFLRTDRRVPVRRGALPKKAANQLKLAGAIAATVLLCGGLAAWAYSYGMHATRFRLESSDAVEINGVHNASRAHVMEVAAADIGRNIFFIPLDERKRQLEQIPWVEEATVMRLLPNRISVTIQERTPVAFAQIGPRISLIDANGVVMGMPADRKTKYSFPVIRGITETEPLSSRAAAMKIYNRLVSDLGSSETDGANAGTNYVRQLSEVDLSDPEDVKVTANDPGGTMVVHLGATDFLPHYKLYVTHVAEWRQQFPNLQSVDLRYEGQVVVNPDKPAAAPKPPAKSSPLMNTDNTDRKKATVKPVNAKTAAKPATAKAVAKPAGHQAAKKKAAQKKAPQKTQTAQR